MNKDLYWVWLSSALGAGANCLELVSYYEWNPQEIYESTFNEIFSLNVITRRQVEKLKSFPLGKAEEYIKIAREHGWDIVTPSSEYYPHRLKKIDNPPLVLYVDGDKSVLSHYLSIAIVGARKASDYGRVVSRALGSAMAKADFTVVSGGALGVDTNAHLGAMEENGKTICVLGCGLGTEYLMENRELREKIARKGALITEYPPYTRADKFTFPKRNRIISGITMGTVVVEAGERSGSLITARTAAEQGRDVFAVPGDLVSSSYMGTNELIRNGAIFVLSPNDILEAYMHDDHFDLNKERLPDDYIIKKAQEYLLKVENKPIEKPSVKNVAPKVEETSKPVMRTDISLTENARKVYEAIGSKDIIHVDEIRAVAGISTSEMLSALTEIEILGLVTQLSGRRYKIK